MNLRSLQSYSIDKEFFSKFHKEVRDRKDKDNGKNKIENGYLKKQNKSEAKSKSNTETPILFNSLFWTFYSLQNPHEVIIEQNKFKIKNAFSLQFVEKIKSNKPFLKQNKLKFHEIESSILYDKDISLQTLKCLVLFYKLNLIYTWNNKYYVFESNDDDMFYYIERNREKYTYQHSKNKDDLLKLKTKGKLFMDDIRTQLKSPSSYKVNDLKEMANILNIPTLTVEGKGKTKQQLYEEIITKID